VGNAPYLVKLSDRSLPRRPDLTMFVSSTYSGQNRMQWAIIKVLPLDFAAASMRSASAKFRAIGFSQTTCFPASSAFVLACGGTTLQSSGASITSETVWNDGADGGATGGGISDSIDLPSWQNNANVPPSVNPGGRIGRGVPDVAGNADPATGYQILADGQPGIVGGTSAVAPLWAGLIACINQRLGTPVGFLNPLLYGQIANADALNDITIGTNDITGQIGGYPAGPGWDACTGFGSPNGTALANALAGTSAAAAGQ